jgi:hypothetical protein
MASDRKFETTGTLSPDGESVLLDHPKLYARLTKDIRGEKLIVTFQKYRSKRSDAQNRYIHGVVVPTVRAWFKETQGEEPGHDFVYSWLRTSLLEQEPIIKEMFGVQVISLGGKRFSQMNTKEFAEAINLIVDKMAERDCFIPLPRGDNFVHDHVEDN